MEVGAIAATEYSFHYYFDDKDQEEYNEFSNYWASSVLNHQSVGFLATLETFVKAFCQSIDGLGVGTINLGTIFFTKS